MLGERPALGLSPNMGVAKTSQSSAVREYAIFLTRPISEHGSCKASQNGTYENASPHLVIPLTEELQPLCLLVHEDSVEVARLGGPDLNSLVAPTHHLARTDVGCTNRHALNTSRQRTKRDGYWRQCFSITETDMVILQKWAFNSQLLLRMDSVASYCY